MELLIIAACIAGAFWFRQNVRERGKRFVRAVEFMEHLKIGKSADYANFATALMFSRVSDPDADRAAIENAMHVSKAYFGGKQLPIIEAARQRGFMH
jgi:hypothetical protein